MSRVTVVLAYQPSEVDWTDDDREPFEGITVLAVVKGELEEKDIDAIIAPEQFPGSRFMVQAVDVKEAT